MAGATARCFLALAAKRASRYDRIVWQIERTKEMWAICRDCNRWIPRGTYRFGSYDVDRWYHLECAQVRDSRAFQPFAEEAERLSGATPATRRDVRERNAELEAHVVAQDDDATLAVFADWLQSVDDPWGDLIALELAGRAADARDVLKQNLDDLIGDLSPRMFEWRRGCIHKATLDVLPSTEGQAILEKIFALRTSLILRELHVPILMREEAVAMLNERGRTLRSLFAWFNYNLKLLELPLDALTIHITQYVSWYQWIDLPPVTRLKICGERRFPLPMIDALFDSPLVQRLRWLEITDGALDESGEQLIALRRKDIAHIPVLNFSLALDDVFPEQKAAWRAASAASG
jgi:hypothetical protein